MHDEVFEAAVQDTASGGGASSRDTPTGASSPSEAYANLTLEGEPMSDADRSRAADYKPRPRAASPAKRLHSDMDGADGMDVDAPASTRRGSGQSSPLAARPPPSAATQRGLRATSVDMTDAVSNGGSATGSDSTNASTSESAATSISATPAATDLPPLEEQVSKVMALTRGPLKDRAVGFVVSQKWLERVWARTPQYAGKPHEFSKSATEGEIGPVDNTSLVDTALMNDEPVDQHGEEFVPIRRGLAMEQDFEVLTEEAWAEIVKWYGIKKGSPVIRRHVHNTSPNAFSENLQYELWPPIFTLRKVRKTAPATHEVSKKVVASTGDNFVTFVKNAKRSIAIAESNKVRIWRVLNTTATAEQARQVPSGIMTPEASPPPATPPLIVDAQTLTRMHIGTEREEVTGKDERANEISNDDLTLGAAGLAEDQVLIFEEHDESGEYITGAASKSTAKAGLLDPRNTAKGVRSAPTSGRSTPNPSGPMTRGRTRSGRTRGTVGLTNLGNTCYMNSALQCIRSVEELAIYFLQGQFKQEINSSNPLGHGGAIAKAYAGLLTSIYGEDASTSFPPKNFKYALGRAQPLFSGYGQQDSQEFLSFLVDGLHEDLNRIIKKPYTEYPESDDKTVHDPEAIKALGDKFRAIHRSRNDSVAMDLFNGFYKNTMVCPDCARVSITFDPYSLLTVQLPIEQTWQHQARFVPLRGKVWDVEVDMDKHATIRGLKDYVGKRFGVLGDHIMASEVYSHKFYRHLEDSETIAESNITSKDYIYLYELEGVPSNWPPPKKRKKTYHYMMPDSEDELPDASGKHHDRVMIPVFHRIPSNSSSLHRPQWSLTLWPSYVLLDREEVKDYDTILKKVLLKVEQMTSRQIFEESLGASLGQPQAGSDVVLTTEEDASPNGDPHVHDGSVEGEDNMVEVTMKDAAENGAASALNDEDLPAALRRSGFLPPEFRNLFEMKYTIGKDYVMTGWSSIDTSKSYELISKRVRTPLTRESSVQSFNASSAVSSSDEDDVPQFSADANAAIQMAEQSSDEDAQPSIEPMNAARAGRRKLKQKKQKKQYGKNKNRPPNFYKKGKDRFQDQPSQSYADSEGEDDDRLIRMGEGIVLDWNIDAFDALFRGDGDDDPRGTDTSKAVDVFDDPELKRKQAKRAARRKHGITLDECFAETAKSEVLSQDNAWYCSRCKELRRATKTLEIWTAPDILVVHLKRFASHRTFRDKVDALVDFPVEGLDLTGRVGLPEDKELVYDLFAVDNHYGGLGGGHYTAFAKNFFDGQWYEYNDSSVHKRGNPDSVVTQAAYLLFYRRRSAGPLGPPALQDIVHAWRNPDYEADADDDSGDARSRNASPAGNGLRLDGSSRSGSSSAFAAGAGAQGLRGAGSDSHPAGSRARSGAAAGTGTALRGAELDEDADGVLPAYGVDEGYDDAQDADADPDAEFAADLEDEQLAARYGGRSLAMAMQTPNWTFAGVPNQAHDHDDEDASSNQPAVDEDELEHEQARIARDFGADGSFDAGLGEEEDDEGRLHGHGHGLGGGLMADRHDEEDEDADAPALLGPISLEGHEDEDEEEEVAEIRVEAD